MCDEVSELEVKLIELSVSSDAYPDTLHQRQLFEQYKLCVEMADRVSQRRNVANTLFLTLNTGVLAALATMIEKAAATVTSHVIQLIALFGLILSCLAWRILLRSYRQLNTAKFLVIGAYERMLPSSPYYNAEWSALGKGKDKARYTPLSAVESKLPIGLSIAYFAMIVLIVLNYLGLV